MKVRKRKEGKSLGNIADMKTTSLTMAQMTVWKMTAYWLTLLLFNGTNVYPGRRNKGKFVHEILLYIYIRTERPKSNIRVQIRNEISIFG